MRLLRAERSWSQERLAAEAGLNRSYLSAVERSEQNFSIDNLYQVAEGLGVESWQVLRMEGYRNEAIVTILIMLTSSLSLVGKQLRASASCTNIQE